MQNSLVLVAAAASVGFIHTVAGPDHYVPFIALARIGRWSRRKTLLVTLLCGVGHVLSSVVLGLIGILIGAALFSSSAIESARGAIAGWLLLGFGIAYTAWGVVRAVRNRPHAHVHAHADGTVHSHGHAHHDEHLHVHESADARSTGERMTPWVLFTIFVFGPCEPLIPLVMAPASQGDVLGVVIVALAFSITTIATMTLLVMAATQAAERLSFFKPMARYGHVLAGLAITACGIAVKAGL